MPSDGNNRLSSPARDEIEISIFGPGFGECILVYLGGGDWVMIDSCLDTESKEPAALVYFRKVGLDVSDCLRAVIATHWHDDHIKGISDVFAAAKNAAFACTEAVRQPDFLEVLSAWTGTRALTGGSGIDELRSILAELKERQANTRYPAPRPASANKVLWVRGIPFHLRVLGAITFGRRRPRLHCTSSVPSSEVLKD